MNPSTRRLARLAPFAALATVFVSSFADGAGWSSSVKTLSVAAGTPTEATGDLSKGKTMALTWAAKSSVACFPATQNTNFTGNHVLFGTSLPKESVMTITAVPDDPKSDISLYAYSIGATDFTHVAPNVQSAVSCEASYSTGSGNPGATEKVTLNATTNPYNVVIGVAGANGAKAGTFKLKVELATKEGVTSAVLTPIALESKANSTVTVSGKLDAGGKIALDWAANSSVACFPATENVNFTGNHVIYRTMLPKQTIMNITATPKSSKTDLSVYAYMVSTTNTTSVPPNVPSATTCEAGYDKSKDNNPGVAETAKLNSTTNEYAVYIGVAGANGTTTGDFDLKVELKPRP